MESKADSGGPLDGERLRRLDGGSVLVRPALSRHNPVTGVRGTIRVVEDAQAPHGVRVELVINYPEMFAQRMHERVIPLSEDGVARLLASENVGQYEYTHDGPLNPMEADR